MQTRPFRCLILCAALCASSWSCATARATADSGEELHVPGQSRERCVSWLVQSPASALRWLVLLDELEAEPPDVRAGTVERIEFALESWPVSERRVPSHWLPGELDAPERAAQSTLIRHVDFRFLRDDPWTAWDFGNAPRGIVRVTTYSRGQARALIERVASDPDALPALTELRLAGSSAHPAILAALDGSKLGRRLERLELGSPVDSGALVEFLEHAAAFPELRALSLRGAHFQAPRQESVDALAAGLASSALVRRLTELELLFVQLRDAGVVTLAGSGALTRLEHLALQRVDMGEAGAGALARARLPRLRRLDLSYNPIGSAGVRALARPVAMGGLRELDLSGVNLDDAAAAWFGSSTAWGHLEELRLSRNRLTSAGLWDILGRGGLPKLRELHVSHNPLGARGLWSVVGSPGFAGLERLDAANTRATDLGVGAFAEVGAQGSSLRELDLSMNGLTARSVEVIVSAPFARGLTSLALSDNDLGDEGALALARAPSFFVTLDLDHVGIGDAGLAALLSSDALRLVESLDLTDNDWSHEGASAFGSARVMERLTTLRIEGGALGTPENLVGMIWSPSALHLTKLEMDWDRVAVDVDEEVDFDDDPAALAFALADLPALGDKAISSPYMSAPLRRRISRFLGIALASLSKPKVVETVPEALLFVASSYLRDLTRKNDERLIRPLLNSPTVP